MTDPAGPPIPWHPAMGLKGQRLLTWDHDAARPLRSKPVDGELTGQDEQGRPWRIEMEMEAPTYAAGARLAAVMALVGPIAFPETVERHHVLHWPLEIEVAEHRSGDAWVLVDDDHPDHSDIGEVRILPPGRHTIARPDKPLLILCERSTP